jgi:hypothetical protein
VGNKQEENSTFRAQAELSAVGSKQNSFYPVAQCTSWYAPLFCSFSLSLSLSFSFSLFIFFASLGLVASAHVPRTTQQQLQHGAASFLLRRETLQAAI